jgi:chromosome segregation ATPase
MESTMRGREIYVRQVLTFSRVIRELKRKLDAADKAAHRAASDLREAEEKVISLSDDAQWFKRKSGELEASLKGRELEIMELTRSMPEGEKFREIDAIMVAGKDAEIAGLKSRAKEAEEGVSRAMEDHTKLKAFAHAQVASLEAKVGHVHDRVTQLEEEISEARSVYERELSTLREEVAKGDDEVDRLRAALGGRGGEVDGLAEKLAQKEEDMVVAEKRLAEMEVWTQGHP